MSAQGNARTDRNDRNTTANRKGRFSKVSIQSIDNNIGSMPSAHITPAQSTHPEGNKPDSSMIDAAAHEQEVSRSDASMADATFNEREVSRSDNPMVDATSHELEISRSDISMQSHSTLTLSTYAEQTESDASMVDAASHDQGYSGTDISMHGLSASINFSLSPARSASTRPGAPFFIGSIASPTPSTASSGSAFGTPVPTNRPGQAEDPAASLLRTFGALNIKYPPPPAVASETDSTIKGTSTPETFSERSTVIPDPSPFLPPGFSTLPALDRTAMDLTQMQPTYYIPVYVGLDNNVVTGQPIFHLPGTNHPLSATQNQAEAEDDTLQPLAGTASTIGMETSENPTNITMRTATDHSVPSAQDINVQFANSVAAHRADAVTTDAHSSDEAMYNREADEAASDGETNTGVDTITDEVDDAEEHDGREAVFAPISIMPWAKSCDTHNGDEKTLGLRKNVYRELKATRYDNDWMTAANAPETALNLFIAKVKMDHLIFKGALRIDDEFYVVAKVKGETRTVEKFARLVAFNKNHDKKQAVKLAALLLFADGVQKGEIKGCTGPNPLLEALSALNPVTDKPSVTGAWKAMNVRRGDKELGNMYDIRQKYHRYEMEMNACSQKGVASGHRGKDKA